MRWSTRTTGRATPASVRRRSATRCAPARTTGIGSLPHRSAAEAAAFALAEYDIPAIPSLPRRSPAEGMIAQALVGIAASRSGQYGSIAVDRRRRRSRRAGRHRPRRRRTSPGSARSSPSPRARLRGPVKWQFVGPVTVGVALMRAGVAGRRRVRRRRPRRARPPLRAVADAVAEALPDSPQLVFLDEPWFGELMHPRRSRSRPTRPSICCRAPWRRVEPVATVGVHCCADGRHRLAAGRRPDILSRAGHDARSPTSPATSTASSTAAAAIAWGAVPTDGPIAVDRRPALAPAERAVVRARPAGLRPGPAAPAEPRHPAVRARPAHAAGRRARLSLAPRHRPARSPTAVASRFAARAHDAPRRASTRLNAAERIAALRELGRVPQPAATTSSTTPRSPTPTTTCWCASCARSRRQHPELRRRLAAGQQVGGRAERRCSRRSCTPCR